MNDMSNSKMRNGIIIGLLVLVVVVWGLVITLKAIYAQDDRFSLKLDFGDRVETVLVIDGALLKPVDPTREGYKFVYWELDGKEFDFSNPISSDLALVAKWEPMTYNVSYNSKGGSVLHSQTIVYGGSISKPTNPTRDGFIFIGWFLSDEEYDFTKVVESDLDLLAKWEVNETGNEGSEPIVTTKTETKTSVIAYKTVRQNDSTLDEGKTTVKREGQNGEITIVYTVTYTDGKETSRTEISREINKQPVYKIILVGTKEVPKEPVDTRVITTKTETRTSVIAFKTVRQNDTTLEEGKTIVKQEGQNGEITITYTVTYTDGRETDRTEISRTINKQSVDMIILIGTLEVPKEPVDTTAPTITLLGNATENVANGAAYIDEGATAADDMDGDITAGIVVVGDTVNTDTAGVYVVTYNVSDAAGNAATEVTRTVIVAEAIKVSYITVTPTIIRTRIEGFPTSIQATIFPENATNKNIIWSSSNTAVATVEDGEVTIKDFNYRGIVIITATTIDGSKTAMSIVSSLYAAETRMFWTFNEAYRTDRFDRLDFTIEEDLRYMGNILNNSHFDRLAENLPNVEGKDVFLERFTSIRTKVNAARAPFDDLQIETAKELIAGATYTMTQETATDEAIIKSTIESIIEHEISAIPFYNEVAATVNKVEYTPAVDADAVDPDGINGTYTFTVDLKMLNSSASGSTATLTMAIIATPFVD